MYVLTNGGKAFTIEYAVPTDNRLYILVIEGNRNEVYSVFENPNETVLLTVYDDITTRQFDGYRYFDSINDKQDGTFSILLRNSEV